MLGRQLFWILLILVMLRGLVAILGDVPNDTNLPAAVAFAGALIAGAVLLARPRQE